MASNGAVLPSTLALFKKKIECADKMLDSLGRQDGELRGAAAREAEGARRLAKVQGELDRLRTEEGGRLEAIKKEALGQARREVEEVRRRLAEAERARAEEALAAGRREEKLRRECAEALAKSRAEANKAAVTMKQMNEVHDKTRAEAAREIGAFKLQLAEDAKEVEALKSRLAEAEAARTKEAERAAELEGRLRALEDDARAKQEAMELAAEVDKMEKALGGGGDSEEDEDDDQEDFFGRIHAGGGLSPIAAAKVPASSETAKEETPPVEKDAVPMASASQATAEESGPAKVARATPPRAAVAAKESLKEPPPSSVFDLDDEEMPEAPAKTESPPPPQTVPPPAKESAADGAPRTRLRASTTGAAAVPVHVKASLTPEKEKVSTAGTAPSRQSLTDLAWNAEPPKQEAKAAEVVSPTGTILTRRLVKPSFLEELFNMYEASNDVKKHALEERKAGGAKNADRDRNVQIIKLQLGRLWRPAASADDVANIVKNLDKPDFAGRHERILFAMLFLNLRDERPAKAEGEGDAAAAAEEEQNPMAPKGLSRKQIRVTMLLETLSKTSTYLPNAMVRFTSYLFYSLFEGDRLHRMKGFQAKNLITSYLVLLRTMGHEEKARFFLYDMFFFKSPRSHIALCLVLNIWPQLLQWKGYRTKEAHERRLIDPCLDAILWCVFNTGPPISTRELKVSEAKERLNRECNVRFPHIDANHFCVKLLDQAQANSEDQHVLESTSFGLQLLCRHQTYRWINNQLVDKLLHMFRAEMERPRMEDKKGCQTSALLRWIIMLLGKVCRLYPVEARDECIVPIHRAIEKMLVDASDAQVEEASLLALLGCGHHLQLQVCMFLNGWKPKFPPLAEAAQQAVADFVGTRARRFAVKTIQVQKKKKVFGMLT